MERGAWSAKREVQRVERGALAVPAELYELKCRALVRDAVFDDFGRRTLRTRGNDRDASRHEPRDDGICQSELALAHYRAWIHTQEHVGAFVRSRHDRLAIVIRRHVRKRDVNYFAMHARRLYLSV